MVAHRCQSKKIKITKINKRNQKKKKNENILFRKKTHKITWPMSAKSDKKCFYSKGKITKLPWPMSAKSDT